MNQEQKLSIPLEKLLEDGAVLRDGHGKATAILRSSMAIVSIVSSSALIWIIRRTSRPMTAYHRILLGMSIADIILSLSFAHFNFTAPTDTSYVVWNARGNETTCSIQGFLLFMGACTGVLYNCALNFYSLAVVKYQKTEAYIRSKIEPFLHGVPIVYALICNITFLVNKHFNDNGGGNCYAPIYSPRHCRGYEDGEIREGFNIPCGRGRDGAVVFAYVVTLITLIIVPIIVSVSLGMIYRAVRQLEKRGARYGASPIEAQVNADNTGKEKSEVDHTNSWTGKLRTSVISAVSGIKKRVSNGHSSSASRQERSNSRVVLHRALAFSFAYALTWSFNIIGMCLDIAGKAWPTALFYLSSIFSPLQGFFNFLIFMYPKVTRAKSRSDNITWFQAFVEAVLSTGNERSRYQPNRNQPVANTQPMSHTDDEGKCNIQVQDSENP